MDRLRGDLADGARELLSQLPADHADPRYLSDMLSAVLVAGLYPNLAWLRRWGKGETCRGLKVVAHPGSVNARASTSLVVFYDVQETTARFMYDTSVVQISVALLFAPDLTVSRRTGARTTRLMLGGWAISVDTAVADELLALRASLAEFVQRTVGEPLAEAHMPAIEALSRIFSAHAPVSAADDEEGEEEEPDAAEMAEMAARAAAGGGSSTFFDDGGLSDEVLASLPLPLDEARELTPASWEDGEQ